MFLGVPDHALYHLTAAGKCREIAPPIRPIGSAAASGPSAADAPKRIRQRACRRIGLCGRDQETPERDRCPRPILTTSTANGRRVFPAGPSPATIRRTFARVWGSFRSPWPRTSSVPRRQPRGPCRPGAACLLPSAVSSSSRRPTSSRHGWQTFHDDSSRKKARPTARAQQLPFDQAGRKLGPDGSGRKPNSDTPDGCTGHSCTLSDARGPPLECSERNRKSCLTRQHGALYLLPLMEGWMLDAGCVGRSAEHPTIQGA